MPYQVEFSPDINQSDKIRFHDAVSCFELYGTNDTSKNLIVLYMYILPNFPTHGIKVGMATCHPNETFHSAIKKRVGEQTHELALSQDKFERYGKVREVIYWGVCLDANNENFKDYAIHQQILRENAGLTERDQEWFINTPSEELIDIFDRYRTKGLEKEIYKPRKEQQECIDALKTYFDAHPTGGRFLLNCKMRFGKSYTTYKYCEDAGLKKILILTFIPAVESSWKEDLSHIKADYKYLTDKELSHPLFNCFIGEPYVLFLSLQNFLGKDKNTQATKEKIKKLQNEHFDLVILDEYHFGAWNQRTQEKIIEDFNPEYQKELAKTGDVIGKFGIKADKVICLSGTPFKAIARGEFTSENTFTYSYFDEQKNKYPNDDFKHPTPPYDRFPDMKIFGYNMSRLFGNLTSQVFSEDKILSKRYFSLNKFFETRRDSNENEPIRFVYEDEIKRWLEIIKGRSTFGDKFPYSQQDMLLSAKHTLWLMPSVNSCVAMAKLLEDDEYFKKYEIINLSQPGVGSGVDAYDFLLENIRKADNTNKLGSIALTVNKLTIGVTVKEWFSVFVLKDLASPEQYFQSIFRIQTPLVIDGEIKKKAGYVYDFNIDRAAALLLRYAEESSDQSTTKLQIAKLIVKYIPIFIDGDMNKPIEYDVFYQLAQFGDQSRVPLSRKITNLEATTHALDEETMAAMINDPEVSAVLKNVFAHSKITKSKDRSMPQKPEQNGFQTEAAKKGRDLGYKLGMDDSNDYVDLDDVAVQRTFEERIAKYTSENTPNEYDADRQTWFANGFKKGYEQGVNVPIRKLECGREDGVKFVDKVKQRFGNDIHYTKETRPLIENFMRPYLNDIKNIPERYRGMLYKRWYVESFSKAVKNALKPVIKSEEGGTTVGDVNNILMHILARLVEFLYISVYRETTFSEIFKNADPHVFLEAVGIEKKDFEALNKYHIFEENTLNNYIHEFFENESLGENMNIESEEARNQYRNSFGWFGFNQVENDVNAYISETQSTESISHTNDYVSEINQKVGEIEGTESQEQAKEPTTEAPEEEQISQELPNDGLSLTQKIIDLLEKNPKGLKSKAIAHALKSTKKEINSILYSYKERLFEKTILVWKIKK